MFTHYTSINPVKLLCTIIGMSLSYTLHRFNPVNCSCATAAN